MVMNNLCEAAQKIYDDYTDKPMTAAAWSKLQGEIDYYKFLTERPAGLVGADTLQCVEVLDEIERRYLTVLPTGELSLTFIIKKDAETEIKPLR